MAHQDEDRLPSDADDRGERPAGKRPMPAWKKKLLGLGLAIAALGGIAQIVSMVRHRGGAAGAPAGSRGFVSSSGQPRAGNQSKAPAATPESASRGQALWEKAAPYATKFGLSFLAGLVAGLIFRMFMKTMAFITMLLAAGLFCLSYFHVFNFDSSQVRQNYEGVAGWAREHAESFKDAALQALPSGTLGAVGFFAGLKKH